MLLVRIGGRRQALGARVFGKIEMQGHEEDGQHSTARVMLLSQPAPAGIPAGRKGSASMTVKRMDNVGIVVESLDTAISFFAELGLELEGRATIGGEWAGRVTGLRDQRVEIAMMRTPDAQHQWRHAALSAACRCEMPQLSEILGEPDEDSLGATDVAEPIGISILDHFADEFRAAFAEPGERIVDVVHGEHDA